MGTEKKQNYTKDKTRHIGFQSIDPKVDFPKLEEEIIAYWKKDKTFEKSVSNRSKTKQWTFLDGPPFVTGMPHYGSLLSSLPKDVFGRYWTMKGYHVRRVWGWDGHGLPIENKVEGELDIKRKKDIEEKIGIKKFIERCLHYVNQVSDEWEWYIDHIGRWADVKHAYKTWDLPYMESVMWVFKQMYGKGYIYKGLKVSLYCPHCATPISNFEVAMDADNYKELIDAATTYKYQLAEEKDTYILAWSTTPWNKIVTPALAVNPKITYVKVQQGNERYILAKSTLKMLDKKGSKPGKKEKYTILEEFKGSALIGKKYIPHYKYYPIKPGEKSFVVVGGDFVTADEGTGVVTIAAYGEEDLRVMKEENIHIEMHLNEEGIIKEDVPLFGGMYYLKANKFVNEDLAKRGLIYADEALPHNVPLCWRCHTRLYYAPIDAWYMDVQKLKPQMKKTNEIINWFPEHFKYGRFLKSMEAAPDWCLSRNRYWGSPVPVWECACGQRFVPGSIEELEKRSKQKITTLHKPDIDEVVIVCEKCGKKVKRVPEVLDSWIEAGSASFAERHYPFGEQLPLESFYPPDYVAEYTGQIRSWFYVLHVIANALAPRKDGKNILSKNVSVTGVILGTDGRKMSKNYGNYPDPKLMLQKYGGDALRLYLLGSPVMHGEDIIISEEHYRNQIKGMMLILWNTYNFFVTYANLDCWKPKMKNEKLEIKNVLDDWILSLLSGLIDAITKNLDDFDTVEAIEKIHKFVNDFSTWYIRRSRERVGPSTVNIEDKESFYNTTYQVLLVLSRLLAPITPFLAEAIYKNLTDEESVHLTFWPKADSTLINKKIEEEMRKGREVASLIHTQRKGNNIKVRIPFKKFLYQGPVVLSKEVAIVVAAEGNVLELIYDGKEEYYKISGEFDFANPQNLDIVRGEVRDIIRKIQEERKRLGTSLDEKVDVILPNWPKEFEREIKRKTLIRELIKGNTFCVTKA